MPGSLPAYAIYPPDTHAAVAGLFPGQGSQTKNLGEQVGQVLPALLERCVELVGEDPFAYVAQSTRFAQPAIFCASLASWVEHGPRVRPVVLAGHSLGELTALVAAGVLDPMSGLQLAVRRGELMASAAEEHPDGGMLAVLGASDEDARALAEDHGVVLANDNAPGQVVLAGEINALRAAAKDARERGVRAVLLDVAGAFHSSAMAPAVEPFRSALESVAFGAGSVPVISGSTARAFRDVREELAQAIVRPVRWRETMHALADLGTSAYLDFGPGVVLARLVSRNLPDARVLNLQELSAATVGAHEADSVA